MPQDINGPYILDRKLGPRIKEYIETVSGANVDPETIADHLQRKYRVDYGRKKRKGFVASVTRALYTLDHEPPVTPRKKKRKRQRSQSEPSSPSHGGVDEEDSSLSNEESDRIFSAKSSNAMNVSLKGLYSSSKDKSSDFIIDRTPVGTPQPRNSSSEKLKRPSVDPVNSAIAKKLLKKSAPGLMPKFNLVKSSVTFANVGGCETQLVEICKLLTHLKHPEVYHRLGVPPPGGFLLHGPPGCGKSLVANAISGELDIPMIKMAATELISGVSGESEEKIRSLFNTAKENAPCIIFLDEVDAITPKRDTAQREMERRIVAQLISCLDGLNEIKSKSTSNNEGAENEECEIIEAEKEEVPKHVLVIGATSRPDSLEPALRRAGRFDKEISLGIPDEAAREKILRVVCSGLKLEPGLDLRRLAKLSPGYVGADMTSLVREASMAAVDRIFETVLTSTSVPSDGQEARKSSELEKILTWLKTDVALDMGLMESVCIQWTDFTEAHKRVLPSSKREGFATVPDVTWDDVGALSSVREELKWSILYPIQNSDDFDKLGLNSKPQGILLCGPPGCGKTLLAKAVANESGLNFISIKGPELLNMYVGESERGVRQVFQRARSSAPCVIFFDELDALCPKRSDSESGGTVRIVNQLLTEMDGMESRKQIYLIGATNRPDIIDPAILRPGRLDKILYVGFPTPDDRIEILKTLTKNGTKPKISEETSLEAIGTDPRTEYYSGADLGALVHEAAINSLRDFIRRRESEPPGTSDDCPRITKADWDEALRKVTPSVSEKDRRRYEQLRMLYSK